jgi:hypothetical protein
MNRKQLVEIAATVLEPAVLGGFNLKGYGDEAA